MDISHWLRRHQKFGDGRAMGKAIGVSILIVTCFGCSDGRLPTYPVEGVIRFQDGFPVHIGTIELRSQQHGIQARGTIKGGKFSLKTYEADDGAVAGTHDCVIVQMLMHEDVGTHGGSLGIVPPKYSSYKTSGLKCVVEETESNEIMLVIEPLPKAIKDAASHVPIVNENDEKQERD